MRPRQVAGVVSLGLLLASCAHDLPTAKRVEVPEGGNFVPGPHFFPHGDPKTIIQGPDRIVLFDGTPLLGEVAFVTPDVVRFTDGLTVPRRQVESIELLMPQPVDALPVHPLHDTIALVDGTVVEGALVGLDDAMATLAVYAPDPAAGHLLDYARYEISSITLRDRRDSPCARAAVVLANDVAAGNPMAEVSNFSLDEVHVFWLEDPAEPRPEKVLRCFPRAVGASGCQVMRWVDSGTRCGAALDGLEINAAVDTVAHISEARPIYYALRDGETTIGKTAALHRDERHTQSMLRPSRLVGEWRGESHYWDRSWRERQDDGLHAVK